MLSLLFLRKLSFISPRKVVVIYTNKIEGLSVVSLTLIGVWSCFVSNCYVDVLQLRYATLHEWNEAFKLVVKCAI